MSLTNNLQRSDTFHIFILYLVFLRAKVLKIKKYYCKRSWIFPYRLRKLKTVWHVFPCANLNKLIVSRHCLISELIRQFCMKIIHKISMTCVKRMSTRGKRLVSSQNRLVLIISHIHHVEHNMHVYSLLYTGCVLSKPRNVQAKSFI